MHLFILIFWSIHYIVKTKSEEALLFNLRTKQIDDIKLHKTDNTKAPLLTACPPSTERERQFNDELSLSGNSVFLRMVHFGGEFIKNIPIDICEQPLKPAAVLDTRNKDILIGYELYYEDKKVIMDSVKYDAFRSLKERKVNNGNETTPPKPMATKLHDIYHTKFKLVNESLTLVFHWIPVFSIKSISNHQKRIHFKDVEIVKSDDRKSTDKCENYTPKNNSTDPIYSEENQSKTLKDIISSASDNVTQSCGNPYGCFTKAQIIPIWYFNTSSAKIASCSDANTAPVWKSIAKQLTLVDQYVYALTRYVIKHLDGEGELFFGVSGVLKMNQTTDPSQPQEIHLLDPNTQTKILIPKIFYRIIHCGVCVWETAVIIVHNDPSVRDSDRICGEGAELEGWDKIKNTHRGSGLSYVCPMSQRIDDMLGSRFCKDGELYDAKGLNLNSFSYAWVDTQEQANPQAHWAPSKRVRYEDMRYRVNRECDIVFDTHLINTY